MTSIWRKTGDNLKNGTILGTLMAIGIVFGEKIMNFLSNNFPEQWLYLGNWSVPIYLIVALTITGYFIDRK